MRIILLLLFFYLTTCALKAQESSMLTGNNEVYFSGIYIKKHSTNFSLNTQNTTPRGEHTDGFGRTSLLANIADSVLPIAELTIKGINTHPPALPWLDSLNLSKEEKAFTVSSSIVSATLMGLGTASHYVPKLMDINILIRDDVQTWRNEGPMQGQVLKIDDVLQYTPLASTYLLKMCGVKGRHNYLDLALITAESHIAKGIVVLAVKEWTSLHRPDLSAYNTFPSGHTCTAFAGAEILRTEYHDVSPWIGVAGYVAAITTGLLRVYNNRHWAGDVLAGAGVGILSARFGYWVNPKIRKLLTHKKQKNNTPTTLLN